MIVKVLFYMSDSDKNYFYFWPEDMERVQVNTKLLIKTHYGSQKVKVTGWLQDSSKATKVINIIKILTSIKETENVQMSNKFDRITNSAKQTILENKDIVIKLQKGKAVIAALKTSAIQSDLVNDKLKELLNIPGYSDMFIGLTLRITAESMLNNQVIQDAAEAANFVGAVEFSNQFTFLEKFIESTITKALDTVQDVATPITKEA